MPSASKPDPLDRSGWQAPQQGTEEQAQRVEALQRELQALREASRKDAAALAEMRAEVEQARSRRDLASLLALVLATLLAAVLLELGRRWYGSHRVERVGRWFQANGQAAILPPPAAATRSPQPEALPEVDPAATTSPGPLSIAEVGAARPAARPAILPVVQRVPASPRDVQAGRGGSLRRVGWEELMEVRDKADFFRSIGEVGQAVALLDGHVHDRVETSALPWLDLLDLFHSLGRRADFERLRGDFRERFSAPVPDFDHFGQPAPTLEDDGPALDRIVALWPTRRVLDVIEESIFRKPAVPGAETLSLEAYRELVLLYRIAAELSPADATARLARDVDSLLVPPSSPNVGVDIDVTAPDEDFDTLPPLDLDLDSLQDERPDSGRRRA